MLLLDTSVLIDVEKLRIPEGPLAFSTLTYAELVFGIEAAATTAFRRERTTRLAWLRDTLDTEWLAFDTFAAESYATLAARVAPHRPQHARSKDIMLAGHALAIGARLATLNPKDFELVADQVEIVVPELR
ncbi:PIN domain-containing protein [Microbacterium sp. PMB16]|uniref:PIN domain-containing protein n=1 Tax=Microbacterium sp. PMB16 TaxID=3120157 RepID=UPI003F4BC1EA